MHEWERYDNLGLMQQLGIAPDEPGAGRELIIS